MSSHPYVSQLECTYLFLTNIPRISGPHREDSSFHFSQLRFANTQPILPRTAQLLPVMGRPSERSLSAGRHTHQRTWEELTRRCRGMSILLSSSLGLQLTIVT